MIFDMGNMSKEVIAMAGSLKRLEDKSRLSLILIVITISILVLEGLSIAQDMQNYCVVPPYVKKNVPPNIMILMDNSEDMLNQAYQDAYDRNKRYIGYFKPDKWYKYSGQTFYECPSQSSDQKCKFYGNLMNWATMSRFDILQKVLLGGRTASRQKNAHTLQSLSEEWTKTYGNCQFYVNSGNVTISDSGGTCDLSGGTSSCPSPTGDCRTDQNFPCSTGLPGGNLKIETRRLDDAIVGQCYMFSLKASGGSGIYLWSWRGSTPQDLSLDTNSGIIYGTPNSQGTYNITIMVTDSDGTTKSKSFNLTVKTSTTRSQRYSVMVNLPEEPLTDQNGNGIWDPGELYTDQNGNGQWDGKKGVIQEFWDDKNPRARWGMADFFGNDARVDIETCIPASPASSFYTAIQNATAQPSSPLAKGIYGITHYFINSTNGRAEYKPDAYHGCINKDPIDDIPCRLNFILVITSGTNLGGPKLPNQTTTNCSSNDGSCLISNTQWAFLNDLRNDKNGKQFISTYIVHTFGDNQQNIDALKQAALEGGGKFYSADVDNLEAQLRQALQDILRRAASGTAASVLASGEGQGANLIQAVFYPRTTSIQRGGIFDREISWIGRLSNYWYYVDPLFSQSTILEDTNQDRKLNLDNDFKVTFRFDPSLETTFADLYTFSSSVRQDSVRFERTKVLWEAGLELWKRDLSSSPRTIYTTIDSKNLINFSPDEATSLRPYLNVISDNNAQALIRYIHGEDDSFTIGGDTFQFRERKVAIDLNGDGDTEDSGEEPKIWKLGDILNSTPKVMTWIPLNSYHLKYKDSTYEEYINSSNYKQRGVVFAGGNDGMLHAFKLGRLEFPNQTGTTCSFGSGDKACLSGEDLGKELWAFIPKNALPYLKYYADPGYCHIYTIDLTPYLFDASINKPSACTESDYWNCQKTVNSWRTILIGGMRYGGACKKTCSSSDCVQTPTTDPSDTNKGLGYSSYFALDVTDQNNPTLLWEFSREDLGFTTTGPVIVRIGPSEKNGRWFVIFGSGPTGPIDITNYQFLGRSDQNLKIFILDLKTGEVLKTIDTGIQNAFGGSLLNSVIDTDRDYQDDVVYIPYVRSSSGTWQGGVLRLSTLTVEDDVLKETGDVSKWTVSTVINDIGPVTSAVTNLLNQKTGKLWLYIGTGRYFYARPDEIDDATSQRHLIGLTEPCYENGWKRDCTESRSLSDLTDVTDIPEGSQNDKGWYIKLDNAGRYTYCERYNQDGTCALQVRRNYLAERVITDPLAVTTGVVFFTSYKPYDDICSLGGKSFLWAVKYDTGGAPGGLLKGIAILQVSTGAIEQIDLSKAFTGAGGRKSYSLEGVPPVQQGLSMMTTPSPVKRVIHMIER
jgi:hypothetical protein